MMNVAQGHLFGTIFEAILYGKQRRTRPMRHFYLFQIGIYGFVDCRPSSLPLGIYFTLFVICLFVFDNKRQTTNQIVKYTVIAMFVISTAHMVHPPVPPTTFTPLMFFISLSGWNYPVSSPSRIVRNWVSDLDARSATGHFKRVSSIGDQRPQRTTSTARPFP